MGDICIQICYSQGQWWYAFLCTFLKPGYMWFLISILAVNFAEIDVSKSLLSGKEECEMNTNNLSDLVLLLNLMRSY